MTRAVKGIVGFAGIVIILVICVLAYVLAVWSRSIDRPAPVMAARHDSATVARGEYLFKVTWQCWGCHQSGSPDAGAPPSGGRLFDLRSVGPGFGMFYSRNITPDTATGIGTWTDGEIAQAVREGITKDRHLLFPIMPMDWLKDLSDDDVLSIVAYLRSIPPVHNPVPERQLLLPAKALIAFNILKPAPAITKPIVAPPAGATIEYGRYFATAAAGCADCHTPRNLQNGQFYLDSLFAGGSIAFGESEGSPSVSYARNIRPHDVDGIGRWTEKQFIDAVTAGSRPDSSVIDLHMPYAHFKFLAADDLRAVYLYLKSLEPIPRTTPPQRYSTKVLDSHGSVRGGLLFEARCQGCHGEKGIGTGVTSVQLAAVMPFYTDEDLRNFVREGQIDLKMPGFRKTLSRDQLDDIVAFIRTWEKR
jgi:mono/diheme cytochrome c family protein